MNTSTYTVNGVTCSCCMSKVTTAVTEVDGVVDADLDIDTGEMTVTSKQPVDTELVRDAVDGLGYEMTTRGAGNTERL